MLRLLAVLLLLGCGDDSHPSGTGGIGGTGGSGGTGGTGGSGAMVCPMDAATCQPLGSICVNADQCDQGQGAAVCCVAPGCSSPCACTLAAQCPGGTNFLPCNHGSDCAQYGGGKVCCREMAGNQTVQFCTKPSACSGTVVP